MVGQGALVSGADYVQAQRVRRVAQQALGDLFTEVDLIICPTLQTGSPSYDALGPQGRAGMSSLMGLINTGYWDCVGNPVLAVPIGFTESGMPLSMQIAAPPFGEAAALRAGQVYQSCTGWHLRQPALVTDAVETGA
jgi:aspartyl-tRNA(Asn)/glutamyl-tRNA(Gln) amidotransferase subunit A